MSFRIRSFQTLSTGLLALALGAGVAASAIARQDTESRPGRPSQSPPATALGIGKAAPAFELRDLDGRLHSLDSHRGQVIVLEWFNPTCNEVRHQHMQGTMKTIAREFEKDNVVWLAISSTPAGQPGASREALRTGVEELNLRFPILMDDSGALARQYRVKLAPTVFVIDGEGVLRYMGAIDNAPNGKLPEGQKLINYLREALNSVISESVLANTRTEAYGCPIQPTVKD